MHDLYPSKEALDAASGSTGAMNVGSGRDVLSDAMSQLLPSVGDPRTLKALPALNHVEPKQREEGSGPERCATGHPARQEPAESR